MPFFKKKPVVIEAVQFTDANKDVAFNFVQGNRYADFDAEGNPVLKIQTLEGMMTASLGDWIIKGVSGEYYPCKPEIFTETYDFVDTESPKNILPPITTTGTPTQVTWSIKTGTGSTTHPNGTVFIEE